jgi:hypothetical protein
MSNIRIKTNACCVYYLALKQVGKNYSISIIPLIFMKKFPTFHGTQKFITMFTKANHALYPETNESSLPHLPTLFP